MASIPAEGTRWRRKGTGEVFEVAHVGYSTLGGWVVRAEPVNGRGLAVMAKAHWFCTEGYEYVPEAGDE